VGKRPKRNSGQLKRRALKESAKKARRKAIPYHQLGGKRNLVSLSDGRDAYPCVHCGKEFKFGLGRPDRVTGKCMVRPEVYEEWKREQETEEGIRRNKPLGWWSNRPVKEETCWKCNAPARTVPRRGHALSGFWRLEQADGSKLVYCPKGCAEG